MDAPFNRVMEMQLRSAISPPVEASELCELIEAYIKALVARNFAERLTRLERTTNR
jgi:hypothetical protein